MGVEIVIILIIVGILGYVLYQSLPNQKFQKATSLFDSGNLVDAIKILESIFEKHPDAPAKLAECKLKEGQQAKAKSDNEAIKYFNEVIEIKKRLTGNASKEKYELVEAKAFFEIAEIKFRNAISITNANSREKNLKDSLFYTDTATTSGIESDFTALRQKHLSELAEINFTFGIQSEKSNKLVEAIQHYSTAKDYAVQSSNSKVLYSSSTRIEICKLKQLSNQTIRKEKKIFKKGIGIYFGEKYCAVAFKDTAVKIIRNKENEELTPSCVGFRKGEILVGTKAYSDRKRDQLNTILSVRRLLGGTLKDKIVQDMMHSPHYKFEITRLQGGTDDAVAVVLGGKQYTPEQISSEILKKLKADAEDSLGEEVTHAVITVPAYITEKQRNATRIAAQLAGLRVQKLLAEPTAAAIASGVDNMKTGDCKTVMIYDFGARAFDLSILNIVDGQYMEAGTGGDRWLGGDELDRKLQALVLEKVSSQYKISNIKNLIENLSEKKRILFEGEVRLQAEAAKIQLSSAKTVPILLDNLLEDENGDVIDIDVPISRGEFEKLVTPFIERSIELIGTLLKEVGYDMTMIDNILLVGGTSCIPLVKQMLSEKYGASKIKVSEKPILGIAEGAAILSHRLGDEEESITTELTYCTNHNYFIEVADGEGFKMERVIEKQMPLPVQVSKNFKTTKSNQKIVKLAIYSDVEESKHESQVLGFYLIDDNLPMGGELTFDFKLDLDEVLSIEGFPKGKKELAKKMLLGRGGVDHRALQTIVELLERSEKEFQSTEARELFLKFVSQKIKEIESIGATEIADNKWHEIYYTATEKFEEIKNTEDNLIGKHPR